MYILKTKSVCISLVWSEVSFPVMDNSIVYRIATGDYSWIWPKMLQLEIRMELNYKISVTSEQFVRLRHQYLSKSIVSANSLPTNGYCLSTPHKVISIKFHFFYSQFMYSLRWDVGSSSKPHINRTSPFFGHNCTTQHLERTAHQSAHQNDSCVQWYFSYKNVFSVTFS